MKIIGRIVIHLLANMVAILAVSYFVSGFLFSGDFVALAVTAGIFTLIQIFVKPILKLFFGPFIILTFGIFSIVLNMIILYVLDILSPELTIQGYIPLLLGTLIISITHIIVSMAGKWVYKSD